MKGENVGGAFFFFVGVPLCGRSFKGKPKHILEGPLKKETYMAAAEI